MNGLVCSGGSQEMELGESKGTDGKGGMGIKGRGNKSVEKWAGEGKGGGDSRGSKEMGSQKGIEIRER